MTSSSDTLTGFLVHKILTTCSAGTSENDLLFIVGETVVGDDRGVFLVSLDNGGPSLSARDDLGLGTLGRIASALGAAGVLAVRTFLSRGKSSAAFVAASADTHSDGLVHTKHGVVGRSRLPFRSLDIKSIALSQLLRSFLEKLALGELRNTFHALIPGSGLSLLGLRGGFTRFLSDLGSQIGFRERSQKGLGTSAGLQPPEATRAGRVVQSR